MFDPWNRLRFSATIALGAAVLAACGGPTLEPAQTAVPTPAQSTAIAATSTAEAMPTAAAAQATAAPSQATAAPTSGAATSQPAASGQSGEVIVYSSRAEALFKPVIESFNIANPDIKVTVLSGSNGELASKLLEEQSSPRADVLINSDTLTMEGLAADGLFAPNDSAVVAAVPAELRAEDGSWTALTLRTRVIMYNTELVTPDELPSSLLDLTDPAWKGQIGSADSTNGAMMASLVGMRALLGDQATSEFVQGLVANETQFFGGHTDVRKAVGAGELKLGFVNHYYYYLSKAEGAPVGIIFPDQGEGQMGIHINTTNAGMIKGGPNPELAKTFVDFMLSPEGQQIYAEKNFEYPVLAGVPLAEGVEPLDTLRQADIDLRTIWDEIGPTRDLAQGAGLP
ncbi:MAG: extracellular solute-binding protein [Roseiflexaceae bacterium]|nr:extracellular solute-binding protein [Roseiflexaceae bacterium]